MTTGIVAEYNPFHKGHQYHLAQARQLGGGPLVVVMSGNFVQRGKPALADKWVRARMALEGGADLVLELPTPWACASAEGFAAGALHLLKGLGNVQSLSFGCETQDPAPLRQAAVELESSGVQQAIRNSLRQGLSYPAAVAQALSSQAARILEKPNNLLAVQYLRFMPESWTPLPVLRLGAGHDSAEMQEEYASASLCRMKFREQDTCFLKQALPEFALEILEKEKGDNGIWAPSRWEFLLLSRLRMLHPEEIRQFQGISEGLENRILKAAHSAASLAGLEEGIKTKRYPLVRIRRALLSCALGIPNSLPPLPPYLRVLGLNQAGKELLRQARNTACLPILMKAADVSKLDASGQQVFNLECRATDLYELLRPVPGPCGREQTENQIRMESLIP